MDFSFTNPETILFNITTWKPTFVNLCLFGMMRNALSVIMLGTELVYLVAKSIGPKVEDLIFATNSTITLSWCCNPTKK